ncbi:transposase, partial [Bacteroidales bacterium OttesenSCG-928-B11]|nr:transposase [Bacteroidales bacterium OttesenSCG-928-B11]
MEKYKDKYRIPSARASWWDYGQNGAYFVTICTHNRKHFFGKIENGKMILSKIGEIAHQYWSEIPAHFPFAYLGEFVVMPNHVHGI